MEIPESVIEKVQGALNVALSLALVKAPEVHPRILAAAAALDDAINDQPE